jgi:Ca2+-transporting ATPase
MNLFSNWNLIVVVAASFAVQLWIHHNAWAVTFLRTSLLSTSDCLMLVAVSLLPLLVLEARKVLLRHR